MNSAFGLKPELNLFQNYHVGLKSIGTVYQLVYYYGGILNAALTTQEMAPKR